MNASLGRHETRTVSENRQRASATFLSETSKVFGNPTEQAQLFMELCPSISKDAIKEFLKLFLRFSYGLNELDEYNGMMFLEEALKNDEPTTIFQRKKKIQEMDSDGNKGLALMEFLCGYYNEKYDNAIHFAATKKKQAESLSDEDAAKLKADTQRRLEENERQRLAEIEAERRRFEAMALENADVMC